MNKEEAKLELQNCRITSIGKLAHGYVIYESTASHIMDRLIEPLEKKINELEFMIEWMDCYSNKGLCDFYNRDESQDER